MVFISTKYSASPPKCVWSPLININGTVFENTTDTKCSEMVATSVKNIGFQRALFLGDSTMRRLWMQARQVLWKKTDNILFSNEFFYKKQNLSRCEWMKILGIKQSNVWEEPTLLNPNPGPAAWCNGVNITHLLRASGAERLKYWNQFYLSAMKTWFYGGKVDYMDIQFARDLEMQSLLGNTTQESLSRFLQDRKDIYSLCFVNSGIHDQRIRELSTESYIANVKEYLEVITPVCLNIFWIQTTAPLGHREWPQTVAKTREWNDALNLHFNTFSYVQWHGNLYVVGVFDKSLVAKHDDNVHLDVSWYFELSNTLFKYIRKL